MALEPINQFVDQVNQLIPTSNDTAFGQFEQILFALPDNLAPLSAVQGPSEASLDFLNPCALGVYFGDNPSSTDKTRNRTIGVLRGEAAQWRIPPCLLLVELQGTPTSKSFW